MIDTSIKANGRKLDLRAIIEDLSEGKSVLVWNEIVVN